MAKGKFEIAKSASRSDPYAVMDKPAAFKPPLSASKIWPILAAVAGVDVLVVGILLLTKNGNTVPGESTTVGTDRMAASTTTAPVISTVELKGMPRAELEQRFSELDSLLHRDLTLTLNPQTAEGEPTEDPIVLTLTQAESGAGLDLNRLTADLNADVGKESGDSYLLDPRDYLVINEDGLRAFAESTAEQYGTEYAPPTAEVEGAADDSTTAKTLVVRTGVTGRSIEAETLFQTLKEAYETVLIAEDPSLALQPALGYELQLPELVDVNALFERYCKAAREPQLNAKTGEISEGMNGYGFDREELTAALAQAAPGEEIRVQMEVIKPEMDAETLRAHLFQDVLAEAHTNHTRITDRTTNLKLACAEIDGTILLPGDVFSFNDVVGERTEEKGYKEAIAYVHGGESEPTVGGGICQVASSIYYAVLQADLKTIEREPHMYLVDYVPSGMDTTIYWGYIDYKFENNSPYPIKIEASVSGGQVHIVLLGTEWKDYTVELSYEVLDTEPW